MKNLENKIDTLAVPVPVSSRAPQLSPRLRAEFRYKNRPRLAAHIRVCAACTRSPTVYDQPEYAYIAAVLA